MSRDSWIYLGIGAYFFAFVGTICGIHLWRIKRRGGRAPVAFKLLRGPGESLRRRIAKSDEDILPILLFTAALPLVASYHVLWLFITYGPKTWANLWLGVFAAGVVLGGFCLYGVRRGLKDLRRYRDDRLGYLGEREVAEHLTPLLSRGYRVFHDVPAEGTKTDFNLDHVAVGPGGVVVIETKTRRKGHARPGMKDHVVTYDGHQLIWPWGEDRHGLEQAINEAAWLRRFIHQRTGFEVSVKPILAIPGWWVEAKARGAIAVVNSKNVASAVEGVGQRMLSDHQIDLIARQLDERCRDVEE